MNHHKMTYYMDVLINKRIYTYHADTLIAIGMEVLVPFRNKKASGYIISHVQKPAFETRQILDIIRLEPQFTEDLAQCAEWISSYYHCYRQKAFELILPK